MKSRIIHVGFAGIFTVITIGAQSLDFYGLTPPQPHDQDTALIVAASAAPSEVADSTLEGVHYEIVRPVPWTVEYFVSAAG